MVHVRVRDGGGEPRLGLVISRAVGTAVERNRVRRRIRVLWREVSPAVGAVDCVVVVRPGATALSFQELGGHLSGCLRRTGVLPGRGGGGDE